MELRNETIFLIRFQTQKSVRFGHVTLDEKSTIITQDLNDKNIHFPPNNQFNSQNWCFPPLSTYSEGESGENTENGNFSHLQGDTLPVNSSKIDRNRQNDTSESVLCGKNPQLLSYFRVNAIPESQIPCHTGNRPNWDQNDQNKEFFKKPTDALAKKCPKMAGNQLQNELENDLELRNSSSSDMDESYAMGLTHPDLKSPKKLL